MDQLPERQDDLFSFDPRVLWIRLKPRVFWPFIIGALITIVTFIALKLMVPDSWQADTRLIRHQKNMSAQTDIPYLYLQIDFNTVLETILIRENLEKVIAALELDVPHEVLYRAIKVEPGNRSNLITVSVTWNDPQMAVKIANQVCATFLESYTAIQNASASQIFDYYREQEQVVDRLLADAVRGEFEYREAHRILSFKAQADAHYKNLSGLEMKMIEARVAIAELGSKVQAADAELAITPAQIPLSHVVRADSVESLEALRGQLAALKQRYTDDNPKVLQLIQKIDAIQQQAGPGGVDLSRSDVTYGKNPLYLQLELDRLQYATQKVVTEQSLQDYTNSMEDIRQKLKDLASLQREGLKLQNEVDRLTKEKQTVADRMMEARIAMDSNISDFGIIESAKVPEYPAKSYRKAIALALGILAGGATLLYLIATEVLNTTIKTAFDLKRLAGSNNYGEIPFKDDVAERTFYSYVQLLYDKLNIADSTAESRLLAITGVDDSSGKTFLAQEIVEVSRRKNQKIIYIETVAQIEGREHACLNPVLYHNQPVQALQPVILSDNVSKLYFHNDKEIFIHHLDRTVLNNTLQQLGTNNELIIWELFPANEHLQLFGCIAEVARNILLVTQSCFTQRGPIERLLAFCRSKEVSHVGVVVNQVPAKLLL